MTFTGVDWNEKNPSIADAVLIPLHPEFRAEGGGVFGRAASVAPNDECGTVSWSTLTAYDDPGLPPNGVIHVSTNKRAGLLSEPEVKDMVEEVMRCANRNRLHSIAIPSLSSITDVEMGTILKMAHDYFMSFPSLTVHTFVFCTSGSAT